MVSRLKKRPRPDAHTNQTRKSSGNVGRRVYLILLILFGAAVANYLFGDLLILRGDGLVLRDQSIVAAPYSARIETVHVKKGQEIGDDDVLIAVKSPEVLERLADLTFRQADLSSQLAETELRYESAVQLLPIALKREAETEGFIKRLEKNASQGFTTSQIYEEALRANYDATRDRIRLTAEKDTLNDELDDLRTALDSAVRAIEDLKDLYGGGVFKAEMDGSIGANIPDIGAVYGAGEPIMAVYSGEPYVLTYLPRRYLFTMKTGMKVVIKSGRSRSVGVVEEILPVSDALPQEFQNTFKPRDRSQLARIKITEPSKFPLFEKVRIARKYF